MTPSIREQSARHFVQEYSCFNMIVEHTAVVKILHCAMIVNIPAEMFRKAIKDKIFMAPYIKANVTIFPELETRPSRCLLHFMVVSSSGRSEVITQAENMTFMISATNKSSCYFFSKHPQHTNMLTVRKSQM